MYPFESHTFKTDVGMMHYVDEGNGDPIIFVHGNPSWSFEFRDMVKALSKTNRCIAPDHIGFGLSEKPYDWSYLPEGHAKHLEDLILSLDLDNITLVVGDWGGPIGLWFATRHPDRIKALLITNTWAWSVKGDFYYHLFSGMVGGFFGRFLIRKRNFFAKTIVRMAFGDKSKLTNDIHRHYLMPVGQVRDRKGTWVFPKQIIKSTPWLKTIWAQMDVLEDKEIAILWGMKDIAFREKELIRFEKTFPNAVVRRFRESGHYLAEENPNEMIETLRELTRQTNL